ncbi:MAG: biopolymer transporter ExbD [Armatimonadetes bacterium]|nr:biopolymer transporter ExbD [Armatimonadota bacterium]
MKLPQTTFRKARIEIIPMIDAIFFLLVFFMFSSLSMVKMNGLPVALPKSPDVTGGTNAGKPATFAPGKPATPARVVLTIEPVDATIGGAKVANSVALTQAVTRTLAANPGAVVVLRTAPGVSAQRLVETLDTLNGVALPGGKRPSVVIATVAAPPTPSTNVLPGAKKEPKR